MVLSFFRSTAGEGDFDHIVTKAVSMLSDARHSFDLATLALLTDADPATVSDDVNSTDDRINHPGHLPERRLHTPETTRTECRFLRGHTPLALDS